MSKKDLSCFGSFDGSIDKCINATEERIKNGDDESRFVGYVTFYILLVFENGEGTICKTSFDFTKPITDEAIDRIAESVVDTYEKVYKLDVKGYKFVTEDVYNAFDAENKDGVICRFNEESIAVENMNKEMN